MAEFMNKNPVMDAVFKQGFSRLTLTKHCSDSEEPRLFLGC